MKNSDVAGLITAISCRNVIYRRSRGWLYSFEDLLTEFGFGNVVSPESAFRNRLHSAATRRLHRYSAGIGGMLVDARKARKLQGTRIVMCQALSDLGLMIPYFEHRSRAETLACFVEEVWVADLPKASLEMQLLRECDVVFVGTHGSVAAVAAATGRPTVHLPPSVKAERLNPYGGVAKPRSIDLYAMGRRPEDLHAQLLEWSTANGKFYLYDTAGNALMTSHVEHRRHLEDLIQRSQFFLVAPGKSSGVELEGAHQHEVGSRYYEGAAGGAILMASSENKSQILQQNFGYENAVFEFGGTAAGLVELMTKLRRDDGQLDSIRRAGVCNILRHHDHAHRWRTVLQNLLIAEPPSLTNAISAMARTADALGSTAIVEQQKPRLQRV